MKVRADPTRSHALGSLFIALVIQGLWSFGLISTLRDELFSTRPNSTLYHYTSLHGLMGIIESRQLRASELRYMNDSTELLYALDLLQTAIAARSHQVTDEKFLLSNFSQWLHNHIARGPMLFSASFRANGNLLSQWRGYSNHGKGISLGFNHQAIQSLASAQNFYLGECLYDVDKQQTLAGRIIDCVTSMCNQHEEIGVVLQDIEADLMSICALLKHPAFTEEQEWRLVSPIFTSATSGSSAFREGKAMLVPYYLFDLEQEGEIKLDHVYVGPTPNAALSVSALTHYLTQKRASPAYGISESEIPYRPR